MSESPAVDLFDHRQTQQLWDVTRSWRRESPVVRPCPGYVYVARWHDCWEVLRDPVTFSNANGLKSVEVPEEERMLGEMDPPRHTGLRRIVRSGFGRRNVEAQVPVARAWAGRLLDEIAKHARAELVSEFADQLPNYVTLDLMGFPPDDARQVVDWSHELLHSTWPAINGTERGDGLGGAFPEFSGYIDALVEARRLPDAADGVVTRLANSEIDGTRPSPTVLRALVAQIILGGISTSTNLIGSMLYRLLSDPSLHERLQRQPELVTAFVEESLRCDPPVLFVVRNCTRRVELAGVPIEAGERVVVGIASANRDEAVFDDPDAFRLDRGTPRHIAFSGGTHLCVGAGLARVVAREAVHAFVHRFDAGEIELAPGYVWEGVPVFLEYGPARLDVSIRSRA